MTYYFVIFLGRKRKNYSLLVSIFLNKKIKLVIQVEKNFF